RLDGTALALTPSVVLASPGLKFVVLATVGGRTAWLAIDTGAPESLLYLRRDEDLPEGAVRDNQRRTVVRIGDVEATVDLTLRESLTELPFDGLLGMDVLRNCTLAFDRARRRACSCAARP